MLEVYKVKDLDLYELNNFCETNKIKIYDEIPFVFIIKNNSKIIGMCEVLLNKVATKALIYQIFIEDQERNNGSGELLMRSVLNFLETEGIYECYSTCDHESSKFFEKLLFTKTDEFPSCFNEFCNNSTYTVNLREYFNHPCKNRK